MSNISFCEKCVHTARGSPAIFRSRGRAFILTRTLRRVDPFPCIRQLDSSLNG
jgi:hypothetical protein